MTRRSKSSRYNPMLPPPPGFCLAVLRQYDDVFNMDRLIVALLSGPRLTTENLLGFGVLSSQRNPRPGREAAVSAYAMAKKGYGPLLYDTMSFLAQRPIAPSGIISPQAENFWLKQQGQRIEVPTVESATKKYGVFPWGNARVYELSKKQLEALIKMFSAIYHKIDPTTGDYAVWGGNFEFDPTALRGHEEIYPIKATENPLQEFRKIDSRTPKDVDRAHRVLYSPKAPEIYASTLKNVPLNLIIVLGKLSDTEELDLSHQAIVSRSTVLIIEEPINDGEGILPGQTSRLLQEKPGSQLRVSPMTAFTLLHRMGDRIQAPIGNYVNMIASSWAAPTTIPVPDVPSPLIGLRLNLLRNTDFGNRLYYANKLTSAQLSDLKDNAVYSVGVDTMAGRNGWLRDPINMISDLWAKYLLTGRVAFDPSAGRSSFTPLVVAERHTLYDEMVQGFPQWVKNSRGKAFLISLTELRNRRFYVEDK